MPPLQGGGAPPSSRWLLEIGANSRARSNRGRTPLEEARAHYEANPTPTGQAAFERTEGVLDPR